MINTVTDSIFGVLTDADVPFSVGADGLIICEKFCILPILRNSTFDVGSIVNSINPKLVLEGNLSRDIAKLRNFLTPKTLVSNKDISFSLVSSDVPSWVREIYSPAELTFGDATFDVECQADGKTIHWTRYTFNAADSTIFLRRPVSHPNFRFHGATGKEIKYVQSQVCFDRIHTLSTSLKSHYHSIGFTVKSETTYARAAKKHPDLDADYQCAESMNIYLLERLY